MSSSEALEDPRDPHHFSALLKGSRSRVFAYLHALVQNLADAEDLYQQTAMSLWEKFDQYEPGTDFGAWATTVAHYKALNFLRRQSRRRVLFSDAALARLAEVQAGLSTDDCESRTRALAACVERLSEKDRRLLRLRYEGDRSMTQIAACENRTAGAMYTALFRIRKALLACVEHRMRKEAL